MERAFLGGCVVAKLQAQVDAVDAARVLQMNRMSGWDFAAGEVFEVSVNRGFANEEKMLCTIGSRNADGSGTLTVFEDPLTGHVYRAWDDTSMSVHLVDSTVEHIWSATDAREALAAHKALNAAPAHTHTTWGSLLTPHP